MKVPIWKPIVILLVLGLAGWLLTAKPLKLGIDLAGGTTLLYQVTVPEGVDEDQAIEEALTILPKRVDPSGVMNLTWRRLSGNRIEVQMPLATQQTRDLRGAYDQAVEALVKAPTDAGELNAALRLEGDARTQKLAELAGGNGVWLEQLQELADAVDQRAAADAAITQQSVAFEAAEQRRADSQTALDEFRASGENDPARLAELEAVANADEMLARGAFEAQQTSVESYRTADAQVDDLRRALQVPAISRDEVREITNLPVQANPAQRNRPDAIAALIAEHPEQTEAINAVFDAYAAYEEFKGPLDDSNDLKILLRGSGVLEFRIAAVNDGSVDASSYRNQLAETGPTPGSGDPYAWFAIRDLEQWVTDRDLTLEELNAMSDDEVRAFFAAGYGLIGERYSFDYYVLLGDNRINAITKADPGWEVRNVSQSVGQDGFPTVVFNLNATGANRLSAITTPNVGKPMAILLDGKVITAPNTREPLSTSVQISGDFQQAEINYMIQTMKAGSLDAQLSEQPISEKTTGPSLGADNLKSGLQAAIVALIVVAIFIAIYYLFSGLVAVFALFANMALILGVMAFIDATFTLPGIAGIVLTIGMAVDANVLIFERIREEVAQGRDLAAAVRLGYEKALSTIIDANLTTLITCIVLGYTATAEIVGFATTLGIGILATLFTALFCTKVILDAYVAYSGAKRLTMLPMLVPALQKLLSPQVNWLSLRKIFFTLSLSLMIAGVGMVLYRGEDLLDIEFRAGTQVSVILKDEQMLERQEAEDRIDAIGEFAQQIANGQTSSQADPDLFEDVQDLVEAFPDSDLSLLMEANIVTEGDGEGTRSNGFSIASLITDDRAISAAVTRAFDEYLEARPPIAFTGSSIASVAVTEGTGRAPVYPVNITRNGVATLGDNAPDAQAGRDEDITDFLGGVAILVDDMTNPLTIEAFEQRLQSMRQQPQFEDFKNPDNVRVLPIRPTEDGDGYDGFVVLIKDAEVNYAENPAAFTAADGLADREWQIVTTALARGSSLASVTKFSPQVSDTMKSQAFTAMGLSLLAVVIYIWFRFGSLRYGLAAILALVHDITITLGLMAITSFVLEVPAIAGLFLLEDFKIDLAIVAALLTIVGYSLNDTIVVFDRIRENRGRMARATPDIINDSINQTISRTFLTSGTTFLALIVLYTFGGPGVHGFAFAMLMGVAVGTYSSIAIASPALLIGSKQGVAAPAGELARQSDSSDDLPAEPA